MAKSSAETSQLLRRPLYIYDLPSHILNTLSLRKADTTAPEPQQQTPEQSTTLNDDGVSTSTSCKLCQASFKDVTEQRQHVRSDLHKYNLKLSIKGLPPVNEVTFVQQIGDLDESLSGSEPSDSDQEDNSHSNDATLTALLRRQARISEQENDNSVTSKPKRGSGSPPILWLSSSQTGDDIALGVYKAILSNAEQLQAASDLVGIIKKKQLKPIQPKQTGKSQKSDIPMVLSAADPHFFLCMIGGGHFAAAIISLAPELRKGAGGVEERHAVVKAHKTFHRYTTRRKQGGSQSANDNAKGNAHSAGSSIRRYNEAALETDVRDVLLQWKIMIDSAELLFIRATGTTSRRTLFGPYENQVLRSNDIRVRGFPFNTRRPTQSELLRSFQELTRLKVSTFVEEPEEKPKAEPVARPSKPSKPEVPQRSEEEQAALLHTSQLQNLIRRTKAPGVLLYLTKNELSPNFEFFPANEYHHAPTPLHLSASINSTALVIALLMKAKADPSVANADGKTPYDIAGETKIRNLFRVARHELGEGTWDWSAAHVPPAMAPEEAEAIARREDTAADAAEAERRKADLEKIRQDEERRNINKLERKAGAGKALGGGAAAAAVEKTGEEKREEETRGLTPEMRQRLERERRARAAEARMKAMAGGK